MRIQPAATWTLWAIALTMVGTAGCYKANPHYQPPTTRDRGVSTDGAVPWEDQGPGRDAVMPSDRMAPPDSKPWACVGDPECDDHKPCTLDRCVNNLCQNTLGPNTCLVGGQCYKKGDVNPNDSCAGCAPDADPLRWTARANGAPCAKDGLLCTRDICAKGRCTHPVTSGCVVGGVCIREGEGAPNKPCEVCVPKMSVTRLQAATGKGCAMPNSRPGMCLGATCHGFGSVGYMPKGAANSGLTAAAYIPGDKKVWATGAYEDASGDTRGVIVDTDSVLGSTSSVEVRTDGAMYDLHRRLAVGADGLAYLHGGKTWTEAKGLAVALGNQDRLSVWGTSSGGKERFFVGGARSGNVGAMVLCELKSGGGGFNCANHSGFGNDANIGRLFGTTGPSGTPGPMWAAVTGANKPEDIYYYPGTGNTWSTKSPEGCHDAGNSACAHTLTRTLGLHGSGPDDVWMVGTGGMVLHYDGKKWSRLFKIFPYQDYYTFSGVFSSRKDHTVVFASYVEAMSGHAVRLFTFNTKLNTWFGPITLSTAPRNTPNVLYDIAGTTLSGLTFVGQRKETNGQRVQGWIVKLN